MKFRMEVTETITRKGHVVFEAESWEAAELQATKVQTRVLVNPGGTVKIPMVKAGRNILHESGVLSFGDPTPTTEQAEVTVA